MTQFVPTPDQAWSNILATLSAKQRKLLGPSIDVLGHFVDPKPAPGPGSFWQNPEKASQARAAMRASWALKKPDFQLSWRSSGAFQTVTGYEEVAKIVGRKETTVRIALSKGKGVAHFTIIDGATGVAEIVTIQRLKKEL